MTGSKLEIRIHHLIGSHDKGFHLVLKNLNSKFRIVDKRIAVALIVLCTVVTHHLGKRRRVLHVPLQKNFYILEHSAFAEFGEQLCLRVI